MLRGTFANIRLRNLLAPGTEGGWTKHQPSGEQMSIYDASVKYRGEGTPLVVMEAMKMQNELASEIVGTVREIHAAPQDAVESGAKLVEIEAD